MRLRGTVIGALNLFYVEPGEMPQVDVDSAQALADVATIAILQHRATLEAQVLNEQLHNALNSRIVIEQAKGIVAEHEHLNMEQSFDALRYFAAQPQPPASRSRCCCDRRIAIGVRARTIEMTPGQESSHVP